MLGELAFLHLDLAAPAGAAPAADAFDIDAERARRIEHRRADRKAPALPEGMKRTSGIFAVMFGHVELVHGDAVSAQFRSLASALAAAATMRGQQGPRPRHSHLPGPLPQGDIARPLDRPCELVPSRRAARPPPRRRRPPTAARRRRCACAAFGRLVVAVGPDPGRAVRGRCRSARWRRAPLPFPAGGRGS